MQGKQEGHKAIRFERSTKVTATAVAGTLPCHADGETVCEEGIQVRVELLSNQMDIIY